MQFLTGKPRKGMSTLLPFTEFAWTKNEILHYGIVFKITYQVAHDIWGLARNGLPLSSSIWNQINPPKQKLVKKLSTGLWLSLKPAAIFRGSGWSETPYDIPEPGVFRDKFHSVNVVKGVWSMITALFLNRLRINWLVKFLADGFSVQCHNQWHTVFSLVPMAFSIC